MLTHLHCYFRPNLVIVISFSRESNRVLRCDLHASAGSRKRALGEEYWWIVSRGLSGGAPEFGQLWVQQQSQPFYCCVFHLRNVGWEDRILFSRVIFHQNIDTLSYHLHCISHMVIFSVTSFRGAALISVLWKNDLEYYRCLFYYRLPYIRVTWNNLRKI